MKAEELMIGDWLAAKLQVDDTGKEPVYETFYKRVTSIYRLGHRVEYELEDGVQIDGDISPVTLTPKILADNFGEPYPRGGFNCYLITKSESIHYIVEDRSVSAAPDNRKVFCRANGTYICDVEHVHELQHALRLCGIEKDIVL